VLGAAILGGVGAGVFGSVQEGVDRMVKKVSTYEPNPRNVPKYDELYGLFQNAYGSLAGGGFYKKLNRFTENG
jgi:xylulokinase